MLREIPNTKQIPGDPFRRWFCDETFDLIVWYSPEDAIIGFQLCYRDGQERKALTWFDGKGFSHDRIDDGEDGAASHMLAPILVPDGAFEQDRILALFERESKEIDPVAVRTVMDVIANHRPAG